MSRVPLPLSDDTSHLGSDEVDEVERPCWCCGEPTVYLMSMESLLDDGADSVPCCGRAACKVWCFELLNREAE